MNYTHYLNWFLSFLLLAIATSSAASLADENPIAGKSTSQTQTGIYQLAVAEAFDGTPPRYIHGLTKDREYYELVDGDGFEKFATGDTLSVSGSIEGKELRVSSMVRLDADNPHSRTNFVGARNVAIIYINFSDLNLPIGTTRRVPQAMFTADYFQLDNEGNPANFSEANVKAAFELSSYGSLTLNTDPDNDGEYDSFGPYTIGLDSTTCNFYQAWADAADLQASLEGADLSIYQHKLYIVPVHHCGWNGLAIIGCGDDCRAWSRTSLEHTLAHEIGHNLGLFHAAEDLDGNGFITSGEEAADLGVMMSSGSTNTSGHLAHAPHRYALGWLQNIPGALFTVGQSGELLLSDLDDSDATHPRALYLDLDVPIGQRQIIVSYRRGNFDQSGNVAEFFSPDLGIANTIRVHECLDATCRRPKKLATLSEGESYVDQETGNDTFGLRIEAHTVGGEFATVDIFYGDTDHDGIDDYADNCYSVYNPLQVDTDCDGFGNQCDADFNNDGAVNVIDLGILQLNFFSNDELTDLTQDGVVNSADLGRFRQLIFKASGPAGPLADCAP